MPYTAEQRARWARFYSLGFDLAAAVGGFSILGYWIDRHYGTDPWGILSCFFVGLLGGMYNLVRSSIREVKRAAAEEREEAAKIGADQTAPKP